MRRYAVGCGLLPGRGAVGAGAGVDGSAEPGGETGADTVVVGGEPRLGLVHAGHADLHLSEGEVRGAEDLTVPLDELIRFRAAGFCTGVHLLGESLFEGGNGIGDGLPLRRAAVCRVLLPLRRIAVPFPGGA